MTRTPSVELQSLGFTFTIKDHSVCSNEMAEAIHANGGDDASVGSSGGAVHVAFDRAADSLDEAIESAVRDLANAGYQVSHVEIDDETSQTMAGSPHRRAWKSRRTRYLRRFSDYRPRIKLPR